MKLKEFNIIRKSDKAAFGAAKGKSLKEAEKNLFDICKDTGLNFNDYCLEEKERHQYEHTTLLDFATKTYRAIMRKKLTDE